MDLKRKLTSLKDLDKRKKLFLNIIGAIVLLVFLFFLYSKYDGASKSSISSDRTNKNISEYYNTNPEKLDISRTEYQDFSALEKVKYNIGLYTQYESHKNIIETSYKEGYSYYYASRALAVVKEPNDEGGSSWNLYVLDDKGQEKLLYSGLIQDCCGGGMPTVSEGDLPFIPVVSAATGDVCFFESEKIFVNLRDNPYEFTRIAEGNDCESFSSLQLTRGEMSFEIEPIVSADCEEMPVGTPATFIGLRAISDREEFTYNLENPIEMECVDQGPYNYSVGIGYNNIEGTHYVSFDLEGYGEDIGPSFSFPLGFSFTNGFSKRNY